MERMTRRGQAPVKKELVEASMSAFVFWMGTIAIGTCSSPTADGVFLCFLTCCSYCSCSQSDPSFPRPHSSSRPRDTCTPVEGEILEIWTTTLPCAHISPRCMSKKIDDERESALIKIPLDLHGFLNLRPGESGRMATVRVSDMPSVWEPRLWEHGERRGSTKGSVLQNDAIFKNDTTCSDHIT